MRIQDTKSRIFETSLRLFAADGYENVSIRTIADAVGIKAASIYNYYDSKEEILEACYQFYLDHRHMTRLKREQYEPILRHGTKEEVLKVIDYTFPDSIIIFMIQSLLIIFSRIYTDEMAREIYIDEINTSMAYLKEFFDAGIEVGRFYDFNVQSVSLIILSSRLFVAQSITIKPEERISWGKAEEGIFAELLRMVPYKY